MAKRGRVWFAALPANCRCCWQRRYRLNKRCKRLPNKAKTVMSKRWWHGCAPSIEGYSPASALQDSGNFPSDLYRHHCRRWALRHLDLIFLNQLADYTENRFAMQKRRDGVSDNFANDGSGSGGGFDELCRAKNCQKCLNNLISALTKLPFVNLLTNVVILRQLSFFVKFIKTAAGKATFDPIYFAVTGFW